MTQRKALRTAAARWGIVAVSENQTIAPKTLSTPTKQFLLEPPLQNEEWIDWLDNDVLVRIAEVMSES